VRQRGRQQPSVATSMVIMMGREPQHRAFDAESSIVCRARAAD
jgi:hypothetical protein